jgi:hypothetical protein
LLLLLSVSLSVSKAIRVTGIDVKKGLHKQHQYKIEEFYASASTNESTNKSPKKEAMSLAPFFCTKLRFTFKKLFLKICVQRSLKM